MVYLKEHLEKYPLMQLEDILKLHLQGILGPAHLVSSFDNCLKRVNEEYQSIKDSNYHWELFEDISDEYVRVYLKPYYDKVGSFDLLVKYFILSSQEVRDVDGFKEEVRKLINDENREYIEEYLKGDNYLISHSSIYRDNYKPHYLVICRKYKENVCKN